MSIINIFALWSFQFQQEKETNVGKTKRRLHDRQSEHFKALTQVGHASAVADHTISTGHNIKWDHFEILATGKSDLRCKIKESLLIRDLKPSLNENIGSENLFY